MSVVEEKLQAPVDAAPSIPPPRPNHRFAAFDGMRGLAVLIVILGHAKFKFNGAIGVDVFFVLSGYLITALLLEERLKTGTIGFKNFYMRRALRLLPALFVMIALYILAAVILRQNLSRTLGDSAITLFYAANWTRAFGNRPLFLGHTWSLSMEEQFYLLWPAITVGLFMLTGKSRKGAMVCLLGALAILCYRLSMTMHMPANPTPAQVSEAAANWRRIYFGLDTHGDVLLAGAALAYWTPVVPRYLAIIIGWLGAAGMVQYVFWGSLLFIPNDLVPGFWQHGMVHYVFWGHLFRGFTLGPHPYAYIWVMTIAILIGILNDRKGWLSRILGFKPLAWVGVISYGLYLFHFPICLEMDMVWKWKPWKIALIGIPLSFLIATLSFYIVERPCLRLKDRFRPGSNWARE